NRDDDGESWTVDERSREHGSTPAGGGDVRSMAVDIGRARSDLHAWLDALPAFQHDALAFGESCRDCRGHGCGLTEMYVAPFHVVVCVHNVDEVAALIGQHRLSRNRELLDRLRRLDEDCHELAVSELANNRTSASGIRQDSIRDRPPNRERVGVLAYRHISEVDGARLSVHAAVRHA